MFAIQFTIRVALTLALLNTASLAMDFVHPGILHSSSELATIKANVAAGKEPWKSAYDKLVASTYGKSTYTATPFDTVKCGSYNNPNVGCNEMVYDGMAAYSNALLWAITGNQAHANTAKNIINAWSAKYRANTESNARLVVSWAAPWYSNAAEILRYTNSGFTAANVTQFTSMLNRWLPYVKDETMPGNNWIQSAIEAHLAMAVFKSDSVEFKEAVRRWNFRVTTYIYQTTDGTKPINTPGKTDARMAAIWRDNASATIYVNGLAMETCRDINHLKLGFSSMMYGAEIAWQQGVDVFTPNKKRLKDFLELHGSWFTGSVKVPTNICDGVVRQVERDPNSGVKPPTGGGQAAFEIAYNHLHDRLKENLPYTLQMINNSRPQNANRWVFKWETLTHAGRVFSGSTPAPNTAPRVTITTPNVDTLKVNLGYSLSILATVSDSENNLQYTVLHINGDSIRTETRAPFEWGHATSPKPNELNYLPVGLHRIMVTGVDSVGLRGRVTLYVKVSDAPTFMQNRNFKIGEMNHKKGMTNFDLNGRKLYLIKEY